MLDNPPKVFAVNNNIFCMNKEHQQGEQELVQEPWQVGISTAAKNCRNYIREIVDNLHLEPNPDKKVIALSIGDPTVYGNLSPAKETIQALINSASDGTHNGYAPSVGYDNARRGVAEYLSHDGVQVKAKDVILCSGCSSSLDICISVLADGTRKQNILIPKPGFPIYRTLAENIGVEVRYYNLVPENNWEVNLTDLERKLDFRTAAIVINNPSNPCGSVYSASHLKDILKIAQKHRVPIIADEIYEQLVYPGNKFVSMAALSKDVPLLICGGLAKRFLVPGWRMGWIVIHDPIKAFDEVRIGLMNLSQRIIGGNTLVQGAISTILKETPESFHEDLINTLMETVQVAYKGISQINGLTAFMPQGAMYMMVGIQNECFPQFKNGLEFVSRLMEEESVFCLPGEAFGLAGFMRIITTIPSELMEEACERIAEFCNKYYTQPENK